MSEPTTEPTPEVEPAPAHPNLAAALAAFQAQMPAVHKGKTAVVKTRQGGEYRYSYADLADVTRAAMPLLARHGLSFTAYPRRTDKGDYELFGSLVHTTLLAGVEDKNAPTGSLPLYGNTAQELGSSITYARRYLLGCLTGIVTDDDEDGNVAQTAPRASYDPAAEQAEQEQRAQEERRRRYQEQISANTAAPDVVASLRADVLTYVDTTPTDLDTRRAQLGQVWRDAVAAGALGCVVAIPEPWQPFAGGNVECALHALIEGAQGPNLPQSGETPDQPATDAQEAQG